MRNKQRGVSFPVVFLIGVVVALGAVGAMKVGPAYKDFYTAKRAITTVAASEGRAGSVVEIRRAFDRHAEIDNITVVAANELDISKEGGDLVISFAYAQTAPASWITSPRRRSSSTRGSASRARQGASGALASAPHDSSHGTRARAQRRKQHEHIHADRRHERAHSPEP